MSFDDVSGKMHGSLSEHFTGMDTEPGIPIDPSRIDKSKLTQWAINDDLYYPVSDTCKVLPPAAYDIIQLRDGIHFRKFQIDVNGLMYLPDTVAAAVVQEIEKFWNRSERFSQYNITQRRGILISGPTGCGKTCTSKLACVDVVRRGGVVFPFSNPRLLIYGLTIFRSIQPDTPVVVLMEDVDEILERTDNSVFLNVLDGIYAEFNRVVFVATTNYPERLEERITNRPSRFDAVIEMEQPIEAARLMFLKKIAPGIDKSLFDVQLAASDSDGFSFAHLHELFVSTVILDMPYDKALQKVRQMIYNKLRSNQEMEHASRGGQIGFKPKSAKQVPPR